jgi:hypothetical protein
MDLNTDPLFRQEGFIPKNIEEGTTPTRSTDLAIKISSLGGAVLSGLFAIVLIVLAIIAKIKED